MCACAHENEMKTKRYSEMIQFSAWKQTESSKTSERKKKYEEIRTGDRSILFYDSHADWIMAENIRFRQPTTISDTIRLWWRMFLHNLFRFSTCVCVAHYEHFIHLPATEQYTSNDVRIWSEEKKKI